MRLNIVKKLLLIATFFVYLCVNPRESYAATTPNFSSCLNPQGTVKVSYESGTHGIVGVMDEMHGSDVVYQENGNNQLVQCFCPDTGNGIQTNWWKAQGLSEQEIATFKGDGWTYIENGAAWGLDDASYLAKNTDYTCKGNTSSSGSSSSSSSSNTTKVESTAATGGPSTPLSQVLSLANTGNSAFLFALLAIGIVSAGSGLFLVRKK